MVRQKADPVLTRATIYEPLHDGTPENYKFCETELIPGPPFMLAVQRASALLGPTFLSEDPPFCIALAFDGFWISSDAFTLRLNANFSPEQDQQNYASTSLFILRSALCAIQ
jgi:hypothetical protein